MRIFIVLGFTVVFLSLGFPNQVQADDTITPRGDDSSGVIPQGNLWDSPCNGNPQMEEINARAAAFNNPREVAPIILHNVAAGEDIGVANPENGKATILRNGTFTKVICLPQDGNGGPIVMDDHDQRKIGSWHTNPKGDYEVELAES